MSGTGIVAIVLGVVVFLLLLAHFIYVGHARRRFRHHQDRLLALDRERQSLEKQLELSSDDSINELLRHRAALLSRLMIGEITGDGRENDSVMEEIADLVADREGFMQQNRLLYERWQPGLIAHLRDAGLTEEEIEVCCLYAMGLNGKMIQQYTQDGRHYQNVGLIRRKLGLGEHDKNIDGYIKSLMR